MIISAMTTKYRDLVFLVTFGIQLFMYATPVIYPLDYPKNELVRKALSLNPKLPLALNTMGVVYARNNDLESAVEVWHRAVNIDPRQYDALYNIALVEQKLGHVPEARKALTQFVGTAPRSEYGPDIIAAQHALATLH